MSASGRCTPKCSTCSSRVACSPASSTSRRPPSSCTRSSFASSVRLPARMIPPTSSSTSRRSSGGSGRSASSRSSASGSGGRWPFWLGTNPRCNPRHTRRVEIPMTVAETSLLARIEQAAGAGAGAITFVGSGPPERVEWGRLHEEAQGMAGALQAWGVAPGDHVALLGPTTRAFVTAIQATWLTGAAAVVMPLPMRLASIDEFVAQTRTRIRSADARLLIVDPELAGFLEHQPGDPPAVGLKELESELSPYERPTVDPNALAVLQFTSGATADPKGVMLPHRAIVANLDAAGQAGRLQD